MAITEQTMSEVIIRELNKRIKEIQEEIVKEAIEEFEKRVRKATANVVMSVSDYYSIERIRDEVLIRVKIG